MARVGLTNNVLGLGAPAKGVLLGEVLGLLPVGLGPALDPPPVVEVMPHLVEEQILDIKSIPNQPDEEHAQSDHPVS